jgi:Nucleoside-diphosphate-sugar epimerases
MVYASSAATYGGLPSPQTVGNEHPENPYGYSKYAMDQIAYRYIKENPEMTIVGLKFFNVYGAREFYKKYNFFNGDSVGPPNFRWQGATLV